MSEDILQKITESDVSLSEKKNLLAELRWNRERQVIDAAIEIELENLRWQKVQNQQAFESFTMNGQRFATYADSLPPGYGFQTSVSGMPAVSLTEPTQTDTENGADPPKYRTEQDLSRYRAMARFVTSVHCPGVGIVENLQNYIIGPGFTYTIRTKMGAKPPDGLVAAAQAFVDRFLDDNNWTGNLDRELLARSAIDGEFFLDMLGDRDAVRSGRPRLEVVEPHFVTECGPWGEIQDRYNFPTNFTFGVHSHATRPARVLGYSIQDSQSWRYAGTSQMVHHKRNVHVNAKRGVSDFFPAWEWMESQARLLRNTAAGAAELSAIAYILKYAGASESKVQSMLSAKADVTFTGPNGQTYYRQWKPPGSVINAPAGSEYEAGPAGSERGNAFLQVVQGILRQVATRWNMTEGMVSGDDSNNNMASAVVAGSRFHRYAICRQANLVHQFSTVVWKAIFIAYNAGAFAAYGFAPNRAGGEYAKLESLLELKVEPPPVDELSKGEQDSIYATRVNAGVMSKATWRSKVGLDDDVERENLKKEAAEQPQPPVAAPGAPADPEGKTDSIEPDAKTLGKRVDPKEELLSRQVQEDAVTPQDAPAKYSCLMAMLQAEDAARVLEVAKLVDPQDWADDGREMEPHCTVKYGFLTQDAGEIIPLVRDATAFTLTLRGLSLFPGKEYDVLKLDVSSPALTALNRNLSEALPHADSHPTYVPHVTIGYLKPGTGAKYAGRTCDVSGRVVPVKSLVFSPADGDRVTIPLQDPPGNVRESSAILALGSAQDAAESLMIRRSCHRILEQYGSAEMRQLVAEATESMAGPSTVTPSTQKCLFAYP